jgi:Domain of unknown function (DUF4062)
MKPVVMVSSTCYDLKQVRQDLRPFLEDGMGYAVMLSEHVDFPVDATSEAVENCKKQVKDQADVMVLIIGGRYGSIEHWSGRSITNLEYLVAREKRIPIYVFIEQRVLDLLPGWKADASRDFSDTMDNPRLFDFIEEVRTTHSRWTFPFNEVGDIVTVLRTQFAVAQLDGFRIRIHLNDREQWKSVDALHPLSLRLALERPDAWKPRLFLQGVIEEIESRSELRREFDWELTLGPLEFVEEENVWDWLQQRNAEMTQFIATLEELANVHAAREFDPKRESDDVGAIGFLTRKFGQVYEDVIRWSLGIRRTHVSGDAREMLRLLTKLPREIINALETFAPDALKRVEEAIASPPTGSPKVIQTALTLRLDGMIEFTAAMNAYSERKLNALRRSIQEA